ncbi:Os04g0553401 [Oryza sativa Japonica Group]|uniref:Os04g0553401 protein n=3 Tax=Oryza TaxID=4527 RepID=C7J1T4_ORYSJ|nr:Os04g0553401 [Oryza sativa Japonica Group]BAS90403.1 Os04g0553401 [Oryza sativa Japonica Group]|eukprot:NP_001174037.1 Os04g0553401 [Oryza sativa Japonica Group]
MQQLGSCGEAERRAEGRVRHCEPLGINLADDEAFDRAARDREHMPSRPPEVETRPWKAAGGRCVGRVEGLGDLEICVWFSRRRAGDNTEKLTNSVAKSASMRI